MTDFNRLLEDNRATIEQLRGKIECDGLSDRMLLRFLLLTKSDIERAVAAIEKFVPLWKEYQKPSDKAVRDELATRKYKLGGYDNEGRRIIHMHAAKHLPAQFDTATSLKTLFVILDKVLEEPHVCEVGVVWVVWMEGSGWKNFDLESEKIFAGLYEDIKHIGGHLLTRLFLVNSPWYVSLVMKLMNPFLSEDIKSRLSLVSAAQLFEQLEKSSLSSDGEQMKQLIESPDFSHSWV